MIAAEEGHHECLSILLAHGAEVDKAREVSIHGVWASFVYVRWLVLELLLRGCIVTFFKCYQL